VSLAEDVRARIARRLERGDPSPSARAASDLWGALASLRVARPLDLPAGARVIGVGSAVLGGAGKTPLAVALARELAGRGELVALVGHAYRAAPGRARLVEPRDRVDDVGDDALSAARLLAGTEARVIVAPRRQMAVDHAAAIGCRAIVIDGLLQASPRRLDAAILVLDAAAPWGSGRCPPAGDLRAPKGALLAAADHIAVLTTGTLPEGVPEGAIAIPSVTRAAITATGERVALSAFASARVGLIVTVARPGRIEAALRRAGITPDPVIALADHAYPSSSDLLRGERAEVRYWFTTHRCAVKLPAALFGAPVLALEHELSVEGLLF
jgi:tetraacyldisaccharide 4'-kinase